MQMLLDHFPVFEANQVLTSGHLNEVFDYLDQQTRQTRSNLIGIGIVCGLEIKLETGTSATVKLSRGCGVTSEGYLILEPDDVSLVSYRPYTLPTNLDYPRFKDPVAKTQYPLWELFPPDEPGTTPLATPAGFLDDKAVVLFLELKKQGLRNCSPNNCDDKGSEVIATVRRLLIKSVDLDKIIAAANALGSGLTQNDLDTALSAKLDLPDIRVGRFDVLNSGPATSNDVYSAFLTVFRAPKLVEATAKALNAAYAAFKPVLLSAYPADPFADFATTFGFLDTVPTTPAQVRFLQYYVDLFEDLVRAYDEFRWKGAELICACCPPDDLFPRHLMLGLLHPEKVGKPAIYRQGFLASPAISNCGADTKELVQLFSRLVEMAKRFTNAPGLPKANHAARIDPQIRITPSVLGDRPTSAKAIPYYYQLNGTPPLHHLWSVEKTRRHRVALNLGYRSDEYNPAAPAFVLEPLRYDLEPYDFLRVEGHLGKDYQAVLKTLLLLKADYRLPIDIIALRSGVYDDAQPVNLAKEAARFQDLEALYDSLREELLSSLAEGTMSLYDVAVPELKLPGGTPKHPLLKAYAPNYRYSSGTVGAWYEKYLTLFQSRPYIDINQNAVDDNAVVTVYCTLFTGTADLPDQRYAHAVSIYYFSKLAEIMPGALDALAYADFENKYQDLIGLVRYFRSEAVKNIATELQKFIPQEDLIDRFDEVLFDCKLGPVRAVHEEFVKRVGDLKKRQFLVNFLQRHPGIQHKAGVPLGGTFIIVYHADPAPPKDTDGTIIRNTGVIAETFTDRSRAGSRIVEPAVRNTGLTGTMRAVGAGREIGTTPAGGVRALALSDAVNRIGSNAVLTQNPDIALVIDTLVGRRPVFEAAVSGGGGDDPVSKIIASTVTALADGTVIADFFLPYQISTDGPGMQFVLGKPAPSFSATVGCANAAGLASVTLKVKGGVPPYDVAIDQAGYEALPDAMLLAAGTHSLKVRDAEGVESTAQSVVVAEPITFGEPTFLCNQEGTTYTATFSINGGKPPFTVKANIVTNPYTTDPIPSGTKGTVEVMDSNKCTGVMEFTHSCAPVCTLPCAGITLRRGYLFWLPEPEPNNPYTAFEVGDVTFNVEAKSGQMVQLGDKVRQFIVADPRALNDKFPDVVQSWLDQINKLIADVGNLSQPGKASWLTLGYEKASAPGRLGTLTIEHFECLSFEIQLTVVMTRLRTTQKLNLAYSPKGGTRIVVDDAKGQVPPLEGITFDKCNPNTPPKKLCPKPLDLTLTIERQSQTGRTFVLVVKPSRADPELTYFWEVEAGAPAVGNGQTFTTTFPDTRTRIATVTGFTKGGCMVTTSTRIPVG